MTWQRLNFLFGFVASAASEAVTWHPHGNLRRVRIPSRELRWIDVRTSGLPNGGRTGSDCFRGDVCNLTRTDESIASEHSHRSYRIEEEGIRFLSVLVT